MVCAVRFAVVGGKDDKADAFGSASPPPALLDLHKD